MKYWAQVVGGSAMTAIGLVGLHFGVEYSGWAVFCGLLFFI